jgi:hypothetical protein
MISKVFYAATWSTSARPVSLTRPKIRMLIGSTFNGTGTVTSSNAGNAVQSTRQVSISATMNDRVHTAHRSVPPIPP